MYKRVLIIFAFLLVASVIVYKDKIKLPEETQRPAGDITESEEVLSETDSGYREQLIQVLNDFSLKFTVVAQTSTKYREEDFSNENFLNLIKDLHTTSKKTQTKIAALRTPPEEMKDGVKTFLEGLNKLLYVTQTIIDYSEGKVPAEKIGESEAVFFDAMNDFDKAEEMLGIEIERGQ